VTPTSTTLTDLWLAETIRLREEHWGPLEDQEAVRQVRLANGPIENRVLLRARIIARRDALDKRVAEWRRGAIFAAVLLLISGVLGGTSAAWGALGDGTRVVNIVWALSAILGVHALTFLLWLASFATGSTTMGASLGHAWLWLTRKLARGPNAGLLPQALLALLTRGDATRWLFSTISHLIWLTALSAALVTMLAVLSTARYHFAWATTLLAPETFVSLTQALGWLPARLGFPLPNADSVRLSDGVHVLPSTTQAQWAWWLIGVVVVYGVLPRLLAEIVSLLRLRGALNRLHIDMALPGYVVLRTRLQPAVESLRQEGIAPTPDTPHSLYISAHDIPPTGDQAVLAGVELPLDIDWPPPNVPTSVRVVSNLDSREQRHALLDALASAPAHRLLIACDTRQTPDRGTLALIADLAAKAAQTRVWLLTAQSTRRIECRIDDHNAAQADRTAIWRTRLIKMGIPYEAIMRNAEQPLRWLGGEHD
jgi:hypothetical protein